MKNSLMMVIPEAILSSLLGSLNGYLLAKWKFRGSNLIFTLILFGMFIPYQSILIPLVKFMQFHQIVWRYSRPDPGAYHLWYPDHHPDLP